MRGAFDVQTRLNHGLVQSLSTALLHSISISNQGQFSHHHIPTLETMVRPRPGHTYPWPLLDVPFSLCRWEVSCGYCEADPFARPYLLQEHVSENHCPFDLQSLYCGEGPVVDGTSI